MKKILIRLAIVVVLLVIIGVVAVMLSLDRIVKTGIERVGTKLTGVPVKAGTVSVSVFSGNGSVKDFEVGNPGGFKTPWAMKLGKASLSLEPRSVFADKVIIKSINLEAPEITLEFELDPRANNLSRILANVQGVKSTGEVASSSPGAPAPQPAAAQDPKASKKLQVNEFVITGAKVHVNSAFLGGEVVAQTIPDIHLNDLGMGPEGITPADLAEKVLQALKDKAAQAVASSASEIGKDALNKGKDALNNSLKGAGTNTVDKVTKSLGNLLNR